MSKYSTNILRLIHPNTTSVRNFWNSVSPAETLRHRKQKYACPTLFNASQTYGTSNGRNIVTNAKKFTYQTTRSKLPVQQKRNQWNQNSIVQLRNSLNQRFWKCAVNRVNSKHDSITNSTVKYDRMPFPCTVLARNWCFHYRSVDCFQTSR